MLIQYKLADGQEIKYEIGHGVLCLNDIDNIVLMYCTKKPNDLPTHLFIHVTLYHCFITQFARQVSHYHRNSINNVSRIETAAGPLEIVPLPVAFDKFQMLIGKQEDYNRYFLDEVFEETVLKDCERE